MKKIDGTKTAVGRLIKLAKRKIIHTALQIANPIKKLQRESKNHFYRPSEKLAFKLLTDLTGNKNSFTSIGIIHTKEIIK